MKETEEKYTKALELAMEIQDKHIKLLEYTIENLKKQLQESETKIKTLESQIELPKPMVLKPTTKPKPRKKIDYKELIEKNLLNREKFTIKQIQEEFKIPKYKAYHLANLLRKDERFQTSIENRLLTFKKK